MNAYLRGYLYRPEPGTLYYPALHRSGELCRQLNRYCSFKYAAVSFAPIAVLAPVFSVSAFRKVHRIRVAPAVTSSSSATFIIHFSISLGLIFHVTNQGTFMNLIAYFSQILSNPLQLDRNHSGHCKY